jgi:hypothetical protein
MSILRGYLNVVLTLYTNNNNDNNNNNNTILATSIQFSEGHIASGYSLFCTLPRYIEISIDPVD